MSIDDLVDAGLLPEGFGARTDDPAVLGVTPTGQNYTIVSIKNGPSGSLYHDPNVEEGKIRTVIWDAGTPVLGRLERIGVQNVAGAILVWKEAVAMWATTKAPTSVPMGVLDPNNPSGNPGGEVRGVGRNFTKDVIDWIENPVTQPAAVALVGFPDLEGDGGPGGGGPPGGGGLSYCEDIQFLQEQLVEPMCPAGYVEIASGHICSAAPNPPIQTFGSEYGVVMYGLEEDSVTSPPTLVPYPLCTPSGCATQYIRCGQYNHSTRTAWATFNGAKIGQWECSYQYLDSVLIYTFGFGQTPTCGAGASTSRSYPTNGITTARSKTCCLPGNTSP